MIRTRDNQSCHFHCTSIFLLYGVLPEGNVGMDDVGSQFPQRSVSGLSERKVLPLMNVLLKIPIAEDDVRQTTVVE